MNPPASSPQSKPEPSAGSPLAPGLVEVLEHLPTARIEQIAGRLGIELDSRKRIGHALQLARGLVVRRDLRRLHARSAPSGDALDLLVFVARHRGRIARESLSPRHRLVADDLIERDLLFEASDEQGDSVVLPGALALQLPRWEGEEATGIRSLLAQLPAALAADVARTFSERPPVAPWLLALEGAYRALLQPTQVRHLLDQLEPAAFELLQHVARLGGEVSTEELLDLERQPMRLQHAGSAARVRRGLGYEIERRALLLPVAPNRHLIPHEVLQVLLEKQLRIAQLLRSKARERLRASPIEPVRAQFAIDPTARALASAAIAREHPASRASVGTAKRLVKRLATHLGLADVDAQLGVLVTRNDELIDPDHPRL